MDYLRIFKLTPKLKKMCDQLLVNTDKNSDMSTNFMRNVTPNIPPNKFNNLDFTAPTNIDSISFELEVDISLETSSLSQSLDDMPSVDNVPSLHDNPTYQIIIAQLLRNLHTLIIVLSFPVISPKL